MAVKKNRTVEEALFERTSAETKIEVIAIDGDKIYKKTMTFAEALKMEKKKGWRYINHQIGHSAYPNVIDLDKKV